MTEAGFLTSIFVIFLGAAVLSTAALLTRQSLLVAYMILGIVLGPFGLKWVGDAQMITAIGTIGMIFLLFLLGLHLPPQKLVHMIKKISVVGVLSSLFFLVVGYGVGWIFHFNQTECFVIGAAMMFSSTIIGIKLLPTTVLHHQHTGEVMISVLLFQDLIAILVLLVLDTMSSGYGVYNDVLLVGLGFPALLVFGFVCEYFVLRPIFARFNRIKEYLFLVAIAWCLSMAQLAAYLGLSTEIGAFIAGVSLATSPISFYIAESLKPIRDFFLVMFFFSVGATFNLGYFTTIIVPALLLVGLLMLSKPFAYYRLLKWVGEEKQVAWEVGVRLAQISEFSLIISYVALQTRVIGSAAAYLIQAATILSFMISSYLVVMKYPTPVALSDRLRRD